MAIYRLLKFSAFEPDAITRIVTAYEDALHVLGLTDRHPITDIVARSLRLRNKVRATHSDYANGR